MKTIKTLLLVGMTPFLLSSLTSCTDYQDEIDALDVRVDYLESLVNKVNDNIAALQKIMNTVTNSGHITNIEPLNDEVGGYRVYVQWIKQGPNGEVIITNEQFDIHNGQSASMPKITVGRNPDDPSDLNYYWFIDGTILKDPNGNYVQANGNNGVTPKVRINPDNNHWEISSDGGNTWEDTGVSATGKNGNDGNNGADAPILVRVLSVDYVAGEVKLQVLGQNGEVSTITVPLVP